MSNRPPLGRPSHLPYQAPRSPSGVVGSGLIPPARINHIPPGWSGMGFDEKYDRLDSMTDTVVCRVKVKLQSPKRLSIDEFKDLKGSLLYGRMFKNRIILDLDASQMGWAAFMREVNEWAEMTCGGYYCIDLRTLYFEKVTEAVAFHLRFEGQIEELRVEHPGGPAF